MNNINNFKGLKYNYLSNNAADDIIDSFYTHLNEANDYVIKKNKGYCFNYTLTNINLISQIPKPKMYDSYFFPNAIKTYIHDNAIYSLFFTCKIKSRTINIHFVIFNGINSEDINELNQYVHKIYMWIYILDFFSTKNCSKSLDLYVYLTHFEKELPANQLTVLGSEHVNTGYTTGCKSNTEIVIYRQEEWFKVFIHETFHNFGLDFSDMTQDSINNKLKQIFNVNIEYNLYESYCEVWGRIIHTMIYSYFDLPPEKSNALFFRGMFKQNMEFECFHSLFQALKILHFMDLNFKIVTTKTSNNIGICNHLYREDTSIFSYYIITALLMNNYVDFFLWCKKHNNTLIQFKKTPTNVDEYIKFIQDCCVNQQIKKNITIIDKKLSNNMVITPSLKMTAITE